MIKFLTYITYSSLFISLCCASLSFYYYEVTNTPLNIYKTLIIFFATLFSYNVVQVIPLKEEKSFSSRTIWINKHRKDLIFFMSLSIIFILYFIKDLTKFDIINFTHLFVIVVFYEKILFKSNGLRAIPYIKPFIISYVWACACSLTGGVFNNTLFLIWIECYLFVLSLTIPFDIRDIHHDNADGLKTLATKYPLINVKILALTAMIISLILHINYIEISQEKLAVLACILFIYTFILKSINQKSSEFYFLLGLDGIILLKLLFLL